MIQLIESNVSTSRIFELLAEINDRRPIFLNKATIFPNMHLSCFHDFSDIERTLVKHWTGESRIEVECQNANADIPEFEDWDVVEYRIPIDSIIKIRDSIVEEGRFMQLLGDISRAIEAVFATHQVENENERRLIIRSGGLIDDDDLFVRFYINQYPVSSTPIVNRINNPAKLSEGVHLELCGIKIASLLSYLDERNDIQNVGLFGGVQRRPARRKMAT